MTFQLIDQERAHHAVSRLCLVLNVTRQGYWAWKRRPPSRRRIDDERLKLLIRQAWRASDQTYGAPRLHAELRLAGGVRVGKKRVARASSHTAPSTYAPRTQSTRRSYEAIPGPTRPQF